MMTNTSFALEKLSDSDLLARVLSAVRDERSATAHLIALLMEMDARKLYLSEGFSSLFTYCTQALHLSEHAAYNRIEAARVARRFPIVLELVGNGALTLTTVRLVAPHLTHANHRDVLDAARHKSKRDVELLVATLNPAPDVPSVVRKLPTPAVSRQGLTFAGQSSPSTPEASVAASAPSLPRPTSRRAEVAPLAPERYKIQVTVSRAAYDKLRRAQDLLRHSVPNGDPSIILERALDALVAELEKTRAAKTKRSRPSREVSVKTRHIPAAAKRQVWERDAGRCTFKGAHGRCSETGFLEYHHVVPFAEGGETVASNLELRCRAHNQYEADLWFGLSRTPYAREARPCFGGDPNSFRERVRSALEFTLRAPVAQQDRAPVS